MGFDISKFMNATLVRRTEEIEISELKDFFPVGEKPIFIVQGLDGTELAKVQEAAERNRNVSAVLDGIISPNLRDKVEAIRASLGITENVPSEIAKRLEILVAGSVSPKIELDTAVKICKCFPIEFYQLTNVINRLTGAGFVSGKPRPSGETSISGQ